MGCATEYIQQDVQLFYSTVPQSGLNGGVNVPITEGTKFAVGLVDAFPAIIPTAETVNDEDQVGDGASFPRFVRLYRWGLTFTLGMRLNTELALVLISRALGGTETDSLVETDVYDHLTLTQTRSQGRCPLFTTFIMPNVGGADFLLADVAVNGFTITQTGDAQPTASFNLVGSGYHRRPHNVVGLPNPDTQTPEYHYFHGATLGFIMDDAPTGDPPHVIDLADAGRVMSYSFDYQNNIIVGRRVGDELMTEGDPRSGSYSKNMTRGRQAATLNFRQTLDDNLDEYTWLVENRGIHGIILTNKGDMVGNESHFELEIQMPHGQLQTLAGSNDGDLLTIDDTMMGLKDESTGQFINCRGRNQEPRLTSSSSPSPSGSPSPSASKSPSASNSPSPSPSV